MRLLDLFCGAGGAAMGYHRAGFEDITGVDIAPQPNYPFTFVLGDALEYVTEHGAEFDVIHASPPCQAYSIGARWRGTAGNHPEYIDVTRELLLMVGKPYIIENVPGAPIDRDVKLCGTMFGLKVLRHRYFEIKPEILILTPSCKHIGTVPNGDYVTVAGHGGDNKAGNFTLKSWRDAMGIDWMRKEELAEAVPPAYTEFIGKQIMETQW